MTVLVLLENVEKFVMAGSKMHLSETETVSML